MKINFDEQVRTLMVAESRPYIVVFADEMEDAAALAKKQDCWTIATTYSKPAILSGLSLAGVICIDPPKEMAAPKGAAQALTVAAALTDKHWTDLVVQISDGEVKPFRWRDDTVWWCRECACKRPGSTCWKCGATDTFHPVAGLDDPANPDIGLIRQLAKEVGYAIGTHGSQERDYDIMAMPWRSDAVGYQELIDHLVNGLKNGNGEARQASHVELRPHGRRSVNIQVNGYYKLIDLSIMPVTEGATSA